MLRGEPCPSKFAFLNSYGALTIKLTNGTDDCVMNSSIIPLSYKYELTMWPKKPHILGETSYWLYNNSAIQDKPSSALDYPSSERLA